MNTSKNKTDINGNSNAGGNSENKKFPTKIELPKNNQDNHGGEIIQIDGFMSEKELIESKRKYKLDKVRYELARLLVISLITFIFAFGILFTVVSPESLDKLETYSTNTFTILSNLTALVIGFYFRDIADKS